MITSTETTMLTSSYGAGTLRPLPIDVSVRHQDPFLYVDRRLKAIQGETQFYLDAQGEALQAQLCGDSASTSNTAVTLPVRQPTGRHISSRHARKGILGSIHMFLVTKLEERDLVERELGKRSQAIQDVDDLVSRRRALEDNMASIASVTESVHLEKLTKEAYSLELSIHEMENELLDMKARHRLLTREIAEQQSSVDARMSSYKASLSLLDEEARGYLRSTSIQPLCSSSQFSATAKSIDFERCSPEMAKEHWIREIASLHRRKKNVDDDLTSLYEGGALWHEVMRTVSAFEKHLSAEVAIAKSPPETPSIKRMLEGTVASLENSLQLAESKGWNLLTCCIGAEFAALCEAKTLLFGEAEDNNDHSQSSGGGSHDFILGKNSGNAEAVPVPRKESQEDKSVTVPGTASASDATKEATDMESPKLAPSTLSQVPPDSDNDEPDPAWL